MRASHLLRRCFLMGMGLLMIMLFPAGAWADDAAKIYDGRLQGFGSPPDTKSVTLDISGTALYWMLLVALGGVTIGGLFKSAKRSHLD